MTEFEISYLLVSFAAGLLTVLAPCVLPLLPVIIGGSTTTKSLKKPLTIILSLAVSVIVFSLILKVSTVALQINPNFWPKLSGSILIIFGILTLFPEAWTWVETKLGLGKSNKLLGAGMKKDGVAGDVLIGGALGPIFSSCSPAYLAIVSTTLPASYLTGMAYLVTYVIGLSVPLIGIALLGNKLTAKLSSLSNPKGTFKRVMAVIFIVLGAAVFTGQDKVIEAKLVNSGLYQSVVELENKLTE